MLRVPWRRLMSTALESASLRAVSPSVSADGVQREASEIFDKYRAITDYDARSDYINFLAKNCGINVDAVDTAIARYQKNPNQIIALRAATTPAYARIFQAIGNLTGGVKFVCDFRTDVLKTLDHLKRGPHDVEALAALRTLDATLREKLTLWFCLSNLRLQRLTWETPADILQKVATHEAVHPVQGLIDMQRRLGPARRCFVFFHESMPREPLVIVYVALAEDISADVQEIISKELLSPEDEARATTAIYYSISSTQPGLRGIDLGNLLIKQVAYHLMRDNPSIVQHSTLSPIPLFRHWLLRCLRGASEFGDILDPFVLSEMRNLPELTLSTPDEVREHLIEIIESNSIAQYAKLKRLFIYLASVYLYRAKKASGYAHNPVANFHLRNGAEIYRVNFAGNRSLRGIKESCGLMVNYRYVLDKVSTNHTGYVSDFRVATGEPFIDFLASCTVESSSKL